MSQPGNCRNEKSAFEISKADARFKLFHEQHLSRPFDGTVQLTLIVRGQAGVFARQDAALIRDELFEQIDVFEIERIKRKINLGFGPRRAVLGRAAFATSGFIFVGFAWHKLFNFAVQRVPAQKRVEFFNLQLLRLKFFIASGGVAGRRFAFLARLRAFNGNDFSGHKLFFFFNRFFLGVVVFFNFHSASAIH